MPKISDIMKEYFETDNLSEGYKSPQRKYLFKGLLNETSMPVQAKKMEWNIESDPERFVRVFKFEDRRRLIDFVNEILAYEDEISHHSNITIDHEKVTVEINTKTIEKITERDVEFTQALSKVYLDVLDYQYGETNEF